MRLLLLLAAFVPAVASAQGTAPRAAHPPVPLATDTFLAGLARDLSAHFKLDGELQLEFIRPWAPPSRVAGEWTISILDFPQVPSSSMLVRCRILADGQTAAEPTVVLRANHWRDAWVTLQPVASGAGFDPTDRKSVV